MSVDLSTVRRSNHFNTRNTLFVARIRNPPDAESTKKGSVSPDRKQPKSLIPTYSYSCFANSKNNSVYLTEHPLSGKTITGSGSGLMKDDINNKFLYRSSEIFGFDRVYDETSTQKEFYEQNIRDIIPFLINGQRFFITAIGAHNSGKSYTYIGEEKRMGIVPQLVRDLLLESQEYENLTLKMRCFALLNSKYMDLLSGDIIDPKTVSEPIFTEIKVSDAKQFVESFSQAVNLLFSLETPSNALRKAAMCTQIILMSEGGSKTREISSASFWELPDISYLHYKKVFTAKEMQDLEMLFNCVFDHFGDRFTKPALKRKAEGDQHLILNLFPPQKKNEKLLLISHMSPSIKHYKKNQQTLKWSADLRNLILKRGETKVSSFIELDATPKSTSKEKRTKSKKKSTKKIKKVERSTSNRSIKSTHSSTKKLPLKEKNVILSYSQSPKELQRQIEARQNQLTELETEMLYQKAPPEQTNEKLDMIINLQDQIQKLKKAQTASDLDENGSSPKFLSSKKGTLKSVTSVDKSRGVSPKSILSKKSLRTTPKNAGDIPSITTLNDRSQEIPRRISRISERLDQQTDTTPSHISKPKTPQGKFSELVAKQKSNLQVQLADTLGPQDDIENRNMNVYNSQARDYTDIGQGFPSTTMSYVKQDVSENPIPRGTFLESQEDDLKPFMAILDEAKEINAKKSKYFNFLDEAEEIFVNEELEDCKWDKLARKYRQLYYRGREVKKLLYEFADSNTALSKTVEDLLRNKGELNKQIATLRQEIEVVKKDFGRVHSNLSETSNKFSQQKAAFQQRIDDLEYANEALKAQLADKRSEVEKLQVRIEERDRAIALLELQHDQKNDEDRKALNEETRIKALLEDRIKSLEQKLESKEKAFVQIQEERIKDQYLRSELEADIDLLQKKLKSSEREYEEMKKENKELTIKLNSYNRSLDEMQERVHEQEFNKRGQYEQIEQLKEKIQELKERNRELQDSNNQLSSTNSKLLLDLKMKDRFEQMANQQRFDNEMLKEKINQQEEELLRLNRDLVKLDEECRMKSSLVNQLQEENKKLLGKDEELTTTREKERKQRKKLNELQLKLEQLENEMRRKEAKLNEFEQEFKSVESEDLMLKRENNQLKSELESLKREHLLALDAVDKMKRIETELQYELDVVRREKDTFKSKLNITKYEKEQLKEEKEMLLARDSSQTRTAQRFQEDRERKTEDALKNLSSLRGMIDTFRKNRDSQKTTHY